MNLISKNAVMVGVIYLFILFLVKCWLLVCWKWFMQNILWRFVNFMSLSYCWSTCVSIDFVEYIIVTCVLLHVNEVCEFIGVWLWRLKIWRIWLYVIPPLNCFYKDISSMTFFGVSWKFSLCLFFWHN